MAANRARIAELIDQFEPRLRDAFLSAIGDLRSSADLGAITAALERGDVAGAIAAMHLDPAAFAALDEALIEAFRTGGAETIGGLPTIRTTTGQRLVIRFDARNPRAEEWLRLHSAALITAIIEDQREAIQKALEDGMQRGINPRTVALDIVGRYDAKEKSRTGGIIGLTAAQERFAANALAELLSGDPEKLRAYLARARRDKRFDPLVLAAIRDGKPVSKSDADRMVQRYRDRLLKLRGDTIARTEALAALHQSQFEALEQVAESGAVKRDQVKRIWRSASDRRVRDTHNAMDGQAVALDAPFVSPSGARLKFPGDPAAPAGETINCRCWAEPKVDFLKGIR